MGVFSKLILYGSLVGFGVVLPTMLPFIIEWVSTHLHVVGLLRNTLSVTLIDPEHVLCPRDVAISRGVYDKTQNCDSILSSDSIMVNINSTPADVSSWITDNKASEIIARLNTMYHGVEGYIVLTPVLWSNNCCDTGYPTEDMMIIGVYGTMFIAITTQKSAYSRLKYWRVLAVKDHHCPKPPPFLLPFGSFVSPLDHHAFEHYIVALDVIVPPITSEILAIDAFVGVVQSTPVTGEVRTWHETISKFLKSELDFVGFKYLINPETLMLAGAISKGDLKEELQIVPFVDQPLPGPQAIEIRPGPKSRYSISLERGFDYELWGAKAVHGHLFTSCCHVKGRFIGIAIAETEHLYIATSNRKLHEMAIFAKLHGASGFSVPTWTTQQRGSNCCIVGHFDIHANGPYPERANINIPPMTRVGPEYSMLLDSIFRNVATGQVFPHPRDGGERRWISRAILDFPSPSRLVILQRSLCCGVLCEPSALVQLSHPLVERYTQPVFDLVSKRYLESIKKVSELPNVSQIVLVFIPTDKNWVKPSQTRTYGVSGRFGYAYLPKRLCQKVIVPKALDSEFSHSSSSIYLFDGLELVKSLERFVVTSPAKCLAGYLQNNGQGSGENEVQIKLCTGFYCSNEREANAKRIKVSQHESLGEIIVFSSGEDYYLGCSFFLAKVDRDGDDCSIEKFVNTIGCVCGKNTNNVSVRFKPTPRLKDFQVGYVFKGLFLDPILTRTVAQPIPLVIVGKTGAGKTKLAMSLGMPGIPHRGSGESVTLTVAPVVTGGSPEFVVYDFPGHSDTRFPDWYVLGCAFDSLASSGRGLIPPALLVAVGEPGGYLVPQLNEPMFVHPGIIVSDEPDLSLVSKDFFEFVATTKPREVLESSLFPGTQPICDWPGLVPVFKAIDEEILSCNQLDESINQEAYENKRTFIQNRIELLSSVGWCPGYVRKFEDSLGNLEQKFELVLSQTRSFLKKKSSREDSIKVSPQQLVVGSDESKQENEEKSNSRNLLFQSALESWAILQSQLRPGLGATRRGKIVSDMRSLLTRLNELAPVGWSSFADPESILVPPADDDWNIRATSSIVETYDLANTKVLVTRTELESLSSKRARVALVSMTVLRQVGIDLIGCACDQIPTDNHMFDVFRFTTSSISSKVVNVTKQDIRIDCDGLVEKEGVKKIDRLWALLPKTQTEEHKKKGTVELGWFKLSDGVDDPIDKTLKSCQLIQLSPLWNSVLPVGTIFIIFPKPTVN